MNDDKKSSVSKSTLLERKIFKALAIGRFKGPNFVNLANELLSTESIYPVIRPVLFAGFCSWVLAPYDRKRYHDAMRIAARKIYDEACDDLLEKRIEGVPPIIWKKKDVRRFRSRVYDALGGHQAVYDAFSALNSPDEEDSADWASDWVSLIALARVWHHTIDGKLLPKGRKLTISAGCRLAGEIGWRGAEGKQTREGRTIELALESRNQLIAFRYAAEGLVLPKVEMLAHRLDEGTLTYELARPVLHEWFGRAKYYHNNVLSQLAKPTGEPDYRYGPRFLDLKDLRVDLVPFSPSPFSKGAAGIILREYK